MNSQPIFWEEEQPTRPQPQEDTRLRRELRAQLLALNFHAFARYVCRLLEALGYEEVTLSGRTDWKGRNQDGGFDIAAWVPAGLGRRRIIASCKQYDTLPVYQRSVDELRGTCLRAGASEALLITTSTFSRTVQENASKYAGFPIAPVRLVSGDELLDRCLLHRTGVREEGAPGKPSRLVVDRSFFDALVRSCAGNSRSRTTAAPATPSVRLRPCVTVTVRVGGNGPAATACLRKGVR